MRAKILVVDDSVTIRRVVDSTLQEEGFEVLSYSSAEDALAAFEAGAPDAVIADVHLPGTTGYAVAAEMKAQRPDVPVLLLVGTFEPLDIDEVERSGALGYLMKPFDAGELISRVAAMLPSDAVAGDGDEQGSDARQIDAASSSRPSEVAEQVASDETDAPESSEVAQADPADDSRDEQGVQGERPEGMSEEDVDRIARRVIELLSDDAVERIASEVVPRVAQAVVEARIAELEQEAE